MIELAKKLNLSEKLINEIEMLDKENKNEAFAHWSSLFSSGNYPDTVMFIVSEMPELLGKIQKFVDGI